MAVTSPLPPLESTFVRDLEGLYRPWRASPSPEPRVVALNEPLAAELGFDPAFLGGPEGAAFLVGNEVPEGSSPVAQAYAGHQFGNFNPGLGDGRALLVGEVVDGSGRRFDLHLKGSGPTPFARGGDGRAALGPMLREYLVSEAMAALGIPTTRALAVATTGEEVARQVMEPGAVLARVAASHLRVGTFEYAAGRGGPELVRRLADHAIARHHPTAAEADNPPLALFEAVVEAQAALVARWMLVGFVHGVMNTDNTTISGETIDYGPCAFLDAYDPAAVFSSIDHGGRYAYGNQPLIAQWNLARLAETLLGVIAEDPDDAVPAATAVLATYPDRFGDHLVAGFRSKLGLTTEEEGDQALTEDLLVLLKAQAVDFTSCFRTLSSAPVAGPDAARARFAEPAAFDAWVTRWSDRLAAEARPAEDVAAAMRAVNPVHVPRNHLVEEALGAAYEGDLAPFERLLDAITHPYDEHPEQPRYAEPAPVDFGPYRTFCGT